MQRFASLVLMAGLAVIAFTACRNIYSEGAAPGVRVRSDDAPYARIQMNTVAIVDDSLQTVERKIFTGRKPVVTGKIAVEASNARRTPTGTLEVWATLRNRTDYDLQVEGRATFFDAQEVPVEGPTAWQRVYLSASSVGAYKEMSTRISDVAYYYIEIREGR